MTTLPTIGNNWCLVGQLNDVSRDSKVKTYFPRRLSLPLIKKCNPTNTSSQNNEKNYSNNLIVRVKDNSFSTTFAVLSEDGIFKSKSSKDNFLDKTFGVVVNECSTNRDYGHCVHLPPLRLNIRNNPLKQRKLQQIKAGGTVNINNNNIVSYTKGDTGIDFSTNIPKQTTIVKPAFVVKQNDLVSSNMPEGIKCIKERSKLILQANNRTLALRRKQAIDNAKMAPTLNGTNGLSITRNRTILLPTLDVELQEHAIVLSTSHTPRTSRKFCWNKKKQTPRKSTFSIVTQDNYDINKRSLITDIVKTVPYRHGHELCNGKLEKPQTDDMKHFGGKQNKASDHTMTTIATTTAINMHDVSIPEHNKHEGRPGDKFRPKSVTSLKNIKKRHAIDQQIRKCNLKSQSEPNRIRKVTLGDTLAACCTLTKSRKISSLYPYTVSSHEVDQREAVVANSISIKNNNIKNVNIDYSPKQLNYKWSTQPKNIVLRFEHKSNSIHQSKSLRYYAAKRHGLKENSYENLMTERRYKDKLAMTDIYLTGQSNDHNNRTMFRESKGDIFERNKTSGSTFSYIPTNPPPSAASIIDVDLTMKKSHNEVFGVVQEEHYADCTTASVTGSVNIDVKKGMQKNNWTDLEVDNAKSQYTRLKYTNNKKYPNLPKLLKSYSVSNLMDIHNEGIIDNSFSYTGSDKEYITQQKSDLRSKDKSPESSINGDSNVSLPVPVYDDIQQSLDYRANILSNKIPVYVSRDNTTHTTTVGMTSDHTTADKEHYPMIAPSIEVTIDEKTVYTAKEVDLVNQFNGLNLGVSNEMVFNGW